MKSFFAAVAGRLPDLLVVSLLLTATSAASAADLRVRVFERGGQAPLSGAGVCLGTPANLNQFGAARTDAGGYALFYDVPRAALMVTASKAGYKGEQESLVTSASDRLLVISLQTGGGGRQCAVSEENVPVQYSGLKVSRIAINNGAAVTTATKVTLYNRVVGNPTQYRASERADFYGATWEPYSSAPEFQLSDDHGRKIVYFQVRRYSRINGADLQTLSPVMRESITFQAP